MSRWKLKNSYHPKTIEINKSDDVRYKLNLSPSFLPKKPATIEPNKGKKTIR